MKKSETSVRGQDHGTFTKETERERKGESQNIIADHTRAENRLFAVIETRGSNHSGIIPNSKTGIETLGKTNQPKGNRRTARELDAKTTDLTDTSDGSGDSMEICMGTLRGKNGARTKEVSWHSILWGHQAEEEHQTYAPSLELGEGPDPFQYTTEDWIDQERHEKTQLKMLSLMKKSDAAVRGQQRKTLKTDRSGLTAEHVRMLSVTVVYKIAVLH
jgi:hypothetical protein